MPPTSPPCGAPPSSSPMDDGLAFWPAADRNRAPILEVLRRHFSDRKQVLEIGSGTAQHAVYFAQAMPQLIWQCSDRSLNLRTIHERLAHAALANTPQPLLLDLSHPTWPTLSMDALYTSNTLHIVHWHEVETLFARLPSLLSADARVVVYGPFNDAGRFTSDSNAAFDAELRAKAAHMGLRDWQAVDALAQQVGLRLIEHCAMPANNRCLVWQRG